jgi:cytochrome b561
MAALSLITGFSVLVLVLSRIGHRFVERRIDDIQRRR